MSAKIVSIKSHKSYEHVMYTKWKIEIAKWKDEAIKRNGGWHRGNPNNIRPHLINRHLTWYFNDLIWSYRIKSEIDLITKGLINNHWY